MCAGAMCADAGVSQKEEVPVCPLLLVVMETKLGVVLVMLVLSQSHPHHRQDMHFCTPHPFVAAVSKRALFSGQHLTRVAKRLQG